VLQSACLAKEKELFTRRLQLLHFTSEIPPESIEETEARQTFDGVHTSVGFLTFRRMQTAHLVAQQQIDSRPGLCGARLAPEPGVVQWEWLGVKPARQLWRRAWIALATTVLFIALCVPLGMLAQSGGSGGNDPYLTSLLTEFGPTVLLYLLIRGVSPLLNQLTDREAHHTLDAALKAAQWKHFYLSLLAMLAMCILPQIVPPLMKAAVDPPAGNRQIVLEFIAHSFIHEFVENLATRALKVCGYILFVGLLVGSCSMFRVEDFLLLVLRLRKAQTSTGRNDAHQRYRAESFSFSTQYARHSALFAIALALCTIVPLAMPCLVLYLVVWYGSDKYNLLMIHSAEHRLGGRLAPVSFDFLFLALLLYQLLMVFVFVLNNSLVLTAIVLVSPVITIIAWKMMSNKYRWQALTIPHDLFTQADLHPTGPANKPLLVEKDPMLQGQQPTKTLVSAVEPPPQAGVADKLNPVALDDLPFPPGYSYLHPALRD